MAFQDAMAGDTPANIGVKALIGLDAWSVVALLAGNGHIHSSLGDQEPWTGV